MPDAQAAGTRVRYWLGQLDNRDLDYLLRELGATEARIRRRWPARRQKLEELRRRYAFRVFAPGEMAQADRWRATFRESELVVFAAELHRPQFQMFGLKPEVACPRALLACGVRREPPPAPERRMHEHICHA